LQGWILATGGLRRGSRRGGPEDSGAGS